MNARVHHEFVNTKFGRFIEICIEHSQLYFVLHLRSTIYMSIFPYIHEILLRPVASRRDELFINNCENFMTAQSWVQNE